MNCALDEGDALMKIPESLQNRLENRLDGIRRAGQFRTLRSPRGVDLSSNDYLGLARHPRVMEALAEGARELGAGSTGSRLLRGERCETSAIERTFADFKGTERSLYFSSGYLANVAVLTTLPEAGDVIFSDQFNHASIIDGVRLSKADRAIFPHNDLDALDCLLAERSAQQHVGFGAARFVVVESLYSMEGDFAPLPELTELCAKHEAALIVDEAHAVGIYGKRGSGRLEETGAEAFVSINTGGKAVGVSGAFVAGDALVIENLLQRARTFIFTTAAPPALMVALGASLDVIDAEPERRRCLRELAAWFRSELRKRGITVAESDSPIVPIVVGDNDRVVALADALQAEGFDVRAVRPPTVPAGTARLRVSLNVNLDRQVLERFFETFMRQWEHR